MSVNDTNSSSSDTLTAEFRDGRLQIVEYSPAAGEGEDDQAITEDVDTDYIHIVNDADNQGWQLSNLNFTIARCGGEQNNQEQYALIADDPRQLSQEFILKSNGSFSSNQQEVKAEMDDEASYVIMFNPEADDDDDAEYVVLDDQETGNGNDSYVVVHGKDGPMVFLQSQLQITQEQPTEPPAPTVPIKQLPTALELLKKAKAVKRAKAILRESLCSRGRKRTVVTPSAEQLLKSPDFKIYLYSCKLCDYQCNRVKEMTEHKAKEHTKKRGNSKTRYPYKNSLGGGRSMQCARCPYRASVISDLLNHVKEVHPSSVVEQTESLDTSSRAGGVHPASKDAAVDNTAAIGRVEEAEQQTEYLICQKCGVRASTTEDLYRHIDTNHPLEFLVSFTQEMSEAERSEVL